MKGGKKEKERNWSDVFIQPYVIMQIGLKCKICLLISVHYVIGHIIVCCCCELISCFSTQINH